MSALPAVILVVNHDPISLDLYTISLQRASYAVFQAKHADIALAWVGLVKPDLILLDCRLPELDGFELCRLLKAAPDTYNIPIVFISAETNESYIERAYSLGAVDFIVKPYRMQQLVARVRNHLPPQEE